MATPASPAEPVPASSSIAVPSAQAPAAAAAAAVSASAVNGNDHLNNGATNGHATNGHAATNGAAIPVADANASNATNGATTATSAAVVPLPTPKGGNVPSRQTSEVSVAPVVHKLEPNTEARANWLSRWTFWYLNPLLATAAKKTLEDHDVSDIFPGDDTVTCVTDFDEEWTKELANPSMPPGKDKKTGEPNGGPQISTALRRAFGKGWWRGQIAYAIYTALTFVPSLVLKALVSNLEGSNPLNNFQAYSLCVAVMVLPLIGSLFFSWHNQFVTRVGYRARSALTAAIYRKSLKLSSTSRAATSVGLIVNIMTNDATKVKDVCIVLNQAWGAPIMLLVAIGLLYWQVREATFVGLGFMISLVPIQALTFKKIGGLIGGLSAAGDLRVKYVNEVLMGIRVIKMYGWEQAMRKRIMDVRTSELKLLRRIAYTISFGFLFVLLVAPLIMPILVFITYIKRVGGLTASIAFSTLSFFNLIRTPFVFLPMVLQQMATTGIALQRITKFLMLEELDSCNGKPLDAPAEPTQYALTIDNGNFVWSVPPKADALANMKAPTQMGGPGSQGAWRGGQTAKKGGPPGLAPGSKKAKEAAAAAKKAKSSVSVTTGAPMPSTNGKPSDKDKPTIVEEKKEPFRIRDVNIRIPKGKLTAIVGAVGSGKTSLMSCMLREMSQESGELRSIGSIAYSAQQPWIVNRSLRDNIIFDMTKVDEQRYLDVISACALELDFKQLPDGDATEIGERGINLSGGQKARVGLARAVYQRADSYYMDDPLSAVDAHVGDHIFHRVMLGQLAGTTRVLVTNHIQFLDKVDHIIMVDAGRVVEQGTYQQLRSAGSAFDQLMAKHGSSNNEGETDAKETEKKSGEPTEVKKPISKLAAAKAAAAKLVSEEERSQGDVSWDVYKYYLRANGFHFMALIMLGYAGAQTLQVMQNFALADWTNALAKPPFFLTDGQHTDYLLKYMAWGLGAGVLILLRSFPFAEGRISASRVLSTRLLDRILHAPMKFFDVTPTGRILNRFSRDIDGVDMQLPPVIAQSLSTAMSVIASIVAISVSSKGFFLPAMVPIMIMYYFIQKYYRRTSTEMQRLASISRSPVYTHFTETLNGLSTIRACGAANQFRQVSDRHVDMNLRIEFTGFAIQNWLSLRLDLVGSLIAFAVAIIAVSREDLIPAGWAGLGLSYAFELTGNLKFGVRTMADTESRMNSVERIQHYTLTTDQEASLEAKNESGKVGPHWPENGRVEIRNLVLEYKPDTPVLKGISAILPARSKVGLAGRTGSGKSTMMLALLRLVEARSGSIVIDGVDIAQMGLQDVRSRLAIIPQDPVLFSDSIQRNIDPFDSYGKAEVERVLQLVHLDKYVATLQDGIEYQVSEGGENFSVGQRQLICMARALLRKPRVLLLDEATASIDVETDFQMQLMLRTHFNDCTVITIAHRLKTIMDSDLIMVLDHGNIVEFDKPSELLKKPEGILTGMVEAHGRVYANVLKALATGSMHFEAALREAALAESGVAPLGETGDMTDEKNKKRAILGLAPDREGVSAVGTAPVSPSATIALPPPMSPPSNKRGPTDGSDAGALLPGNVRVHAEDSKQVAYHGIKFVE